MFHDTIVLVTKQLERYGLLTPLVMLGAGRGSGSRPLDHIDPHYIEIDPLAGGPPLDKLAEVYHKNLGTVVISEVLEQVQNPFEFFKALYLAMKEGGIAVIESSFSAPHIPGGTDFWRLSPDSLRHLALQTGFTVLECDWNLEANGNGTPQGAAWQERKAAYITLSKGAPHTTPIAKTLVPKDAPPGERTATSSHTSRPSAQKQFRCVFLDSCYDRFLEHLYASQPALLSARYEVQRDAILKTNFGDSDFYSNGLRRCGWHAENIIVNCAPAQQAWAREQQATSHGLGLAAEQIARIRPDVVYIQDMHLFSAEFLAAIRPHTRLIVGQIASTPKQLPLTSYDIVISSIIHFVAWCRSLGVTSYYQPLAFEERLVESLSSLPLHKRPVEVSFVGSIYSDTHGARQEFLELLAERLPIQLWGTGIEGIGANSPLRQCYRGEAWGNEMFEILARSKITVNSHATHTGCGGPMVRDPSQNVTQHFANNMRLFEATGCGTLLVTDYKDNLNELFEVGTEVVAYRSPDECAALISYYLAHPEQAAKIARAGFARTLKDHTYTVRLADTAALLERHLSYRDPTRASIPVDFSRISYGHQPIAAEAVDSSLTEGWKDREIPSKQRALVQQELTQMYSGTIPAPFQAMAETLRPVVRRGTSILEIGCSSGYYFEVIEYLLHKKIAYTGVDYSDAMIEMARAFYPAPEFYVADGAKMPFADHSFDVAISSCVLLHTPNYREHVAETVRVARGSIIAHRTPITRNTPTQYVKKLAYGAETVELIFNEREFIALFLEHGFRLEREVVLEDDREAQKAVVSYLFKRHSWTSLTESE